VKAVERAGGRTGGREKEVAGERGPKGRKIRRTESTARRQTANLGRRQWFAAGFMRKLLKREKWHFGGPCQEDSARVLSRTASASLAPLTRRSGESETSADPGQILSSASRCCIAMTFGRTALTASPVASSVLGASGSGWVDLSSSPNAATDSAVAAVNPHRHRSYSAKDSTARGSDVPRPRHSPGGTARPGLRRRGPPIRHIQDRERFHMRESESSEILGTVNQLRHIFPLAAVG